MKELIQIQQRLVAPKDKSVSIGRSGYLYRTAEDILTAAKPICAELGCAILLNDHIEKFDGAESYRSEGNGRSECVETNCRYYVVSEVSLVNSDGESVTATSMARETFHKQGQDESQTTGSATSYARKSALCALFAIDNNKDADALAGRSSALAEVDQIKSREDWVKWYNKYKKLMEEPMFNSINQALSKAFPKKQ